MTDKKSLFDNLNIGTDLVGALLDLPDARLSMALGNLRRFLLSIYHPDVTGKSDERASEINAALDDLSNARLFREEALRYLSRGGPSLSPSPQLITDEIRWYQNRVSELEPFKEEVESLKRELEVTTDSLGMLRAFIFGDAEQLEGRVYLSTLPNFTYLIESTRGEIKDWYSVTDNKLHRHNTHRYLGNFAGGITSEDLPDEILQRASNILHPGEIDENEFYNIVGRILRPYLERNMYVVLGRYPPQEKSLLQVFGKVLDINPKT